MLQPVRMMEDFLRLAQKNTANNLETCGVLAGSLVCFSITECVPFAKNFMF